MVGGKCYSLLAIAFLPLINGGHFNFSKTNSNFLIDFFLIFASCTCIIIFYADQNFCYIN